MTDHDHIDALKVAAALDLRSRGRHFFCPSCQPSGGKTPDLVGDEDYTYEATAHEAKIR